MTVLQENSGQGRLSCKWDTFPFVAVQAFFVFLRLRRALKRLHKGIQTLCSQQVSVSHPLYGPVRRAMYQSFRPGSLFPFIQENHRIDIRGST